MLQKYTRILRPVHLGGALTFAALLSACQPPAAPHVTAASSAQPAVPPDTVALLDGEPLSRSLLDALARLHGGTSNPYDAPSAPVAAASAPNPSPEDRQRLLDELVEIELLARKARELGIEQLPAIRAETELQARTLLAPAVVREQIAGIAVSDAELRAAYEERVPPHRFQVAQILLADAETATRVTQSLKDGQPFATLARRHSTDPLSARQGGNLGWLMYDQMPPEVAAAVRHLQPGEATPQPVQTREGWHVLQLQALEPLADRPTLETARVWLHPQIVHAKVQAQQAQWRREATIELPDSP